MKRACIFLGLLLAAAGCTPKVSIEAPKEPITINLNIKLDADVRLRTEGHGRTRGLMPTGKGLNARGAIDIRSVDLDELLPLVGVDGVGGDGKLGGNIPIRIADGELVIREGRLRAHGPGRLRYAGSALAKQLSARDDRNGSVSKVLSDFHYQKLTLQLDKKAGGLGTILLYMEGANPTVDDGQPFVFNIRIESDFKKLKTHCLRPRPDLFASPDASWKIEGCGSSAAR